jgi:AcrR family transcriptional regulator
VLEKTQRPPAKKSLKLSLRVLRRAEIVAAAGAIVASQGLDALTVAALEERLGYSRGVITYHFRDKDEIVDAVLAGALAEIDAATQAAVDASGTPGEKVRAVLRANLRGFLDHRDAGLVLLSFWGRLSDANVRKASARLHATYRERTASVLKAGIKKTAFAPVDCEALAAVIVGLVIGIAAQAYIDPKGIDTDRALEEATRSVLARLA